MRVLSALMAFSVAATAFGAAALAQDSGGRYQMEKSGDRFIRLDKKTGEMSVCSNESGTWACSPMRSDNRSSHDELSRLQEENERLRGQLDRAERGGQRDDQGEFAERGDDSFEGFPSPDEPKGRKPKLNLPSEQEIDQAIGYLEKMIRKFREKFEDFGEKTRPRNRPGDSGDGTPL